MAYGWSYIGPERDKLFMVLLVDGFVFLILQGTADSKVGLTGTLGPAIEEVNTRGFDKKRGKFLQTKVLM